MWILWHIAVQLLRDSKAQTTMMVIGIMVGAAVVVFISALISGLQANIIDRTLGSQAHIRLLPLEEVNLFAPPSNAAAVPLILEDPRPQRLRAISNWSVLVDALDRMPAVTAVSPMVVGPALAQRGMATRSVTLIGANPERVRPILPIADNMVAGRYQLNAGDALLGRQLADDLGVSVGGRIRLEAGPDRSVVMTVAGVFELGVGDIDSRFLMMDIDQTRTLLNLPGGVTTIELAVGEVFEAERLAVRLGALTGLRAESWMESNAQLLNALSSQSLSSNMIVLFVSLSVAFGIASVMSVSVVQRTREIGILRAMGIGQNQILAVFLIQGALLGVVGAMLGDLVGFGLVQAFNYLGPNLFYIAFSPWLILLTVLLSAVAGTLAAALPARRAARLDPAVAIRHV
ncbi:MAG: FtsX-like permease family protein [Rhodothermales bacterium]|nr:FtsX-like permease family protein [Rhodothermales bacterium]